MSYLTLRSVVVSLYFSIFRKKNHILFKSYKYAENLSWTICLVLCDFHRWVLLNIIVCLVYVARILSADVHAFFHKIKGNHGEYFRKKCNTFHTDIQTKYVWFYWICVLNDNTIDDFILINQNTTYNVVIFTDTW